MGDILLDEQGKPANPSAGQMILYPDNAASSFVQLNDAGRVQGDDYRAAIAQQAAYSADTYITNSGLIIPSNSMQAGMFCEWKMPVVKTAGTAAPVFTVRIGSAQSVADTSRLAITLGVQTAVADTGFITIIVTCRSVGVTGVIQGLVYLQHNLQITGLATTPSGFSAVQGTSAGFDNTALGGQYIGLSINPGASAAWVHEQVIGRLYY